MLYDAIIVGAGPAGSVAAMTLARAGRPVLLVDRDDFPRDKTCGDLIGSQALRLAYTLGVPRDALADFPPLRGFALHTADHRIKQSQPHAADGLEARVIPRVVFDALLVRQALAAGATFRRLAVTTVLRNAGSMVTGVTGMVNGTSVTCTGRVVIGADGWGSIVARSMVPQIRAPTSPRRVGIATRAYVTCPAGNDGRMHVYFTRETQPGYGWIFPIDGQHANVGLGMLVHTRNSGNRAHLHALFERFLYAPDSPARPLLDGAAAITGARTWPLALGWQPRQRVADGALLVGDAAALVSPLTGAGIFNAMRSGLLAAHAVLAALHTGDCSAVSLASYERWCRRVLRPRLRLEEGAQRLLAAPARMDLFSAMLRALPGLDYWSTKLMFNLG